MFENWAKCQTCMFFYMFDYFTRMLIIIIVGNKHILVNLRFGFCQGVLFQVEPISWWLSRFYGGSSTDLHH